MSNFIIAVAGQKGGTGKTTISHMLAHGLTQLGHTTFMVTSDSGITVRAADRPYMVYSGRTDDELKAILQGFKSIPDGEKDSFLIVDGGANKTVFDDAISTVADLVILAFQGSQDDIEKTVYDLDRIPKAYALRSRWKSNTRDAVVDDAMINLLFGNDRKERLLDFIVYESATLSGASSDIGIDQLRQASETLRNAESIARSPAERFIESDEARKRCRRLANKTRHLLGVSG